MRAGATGPQGLGGPVKCVEPAAFGIPAGIGGGNRGPAVREARRHRRRGGRGRLPGSQDRHPGCQGRICGEGGEERVGKEGRDICRRHRGRAGRGCGGLQPGEGRGPVALEHRHRGPGGMDVAGAGITGGERVEGPGGPLKIPRLGPGDGGLQGGIEGGLLEEGAGHGIRRRGRLGSGVPSSVRGSLGGSLGGGPGPGRGLRARLARRQDGGDEMEDGGHGRRGPQDWPDLSHAGEPLCLGTRRL